MIINTLGSDLFFYFYTTYFQTNEEKKMLINVETTAIKSSSMYFKIVDLSF